jgi:hypothetical protein
MEYFEEMGQSQFPYSIALFRLSFCSCSYGIYFGWYPYSPWATSIHVSVDYALTETLLQPSKYISVWMASTKITQCLFVCSSTSSTIAGTKVKSMG